MSLISRLHVFSVEALVQVEIITQLQVILLPHYTFQPGNLLQKAESS